VEGAESLPLTHALGECSIASSVIFAVFRQGGNRPCSSAKAYKVWARS